MQPFQAGCVAIGERGLLIIGPPGSGKSSLALALLDRGARLVGDDSVLLAAADGRLIAHPHPATHGLIEVRNLGLLRFEPLDRVAVALILQLDEAAPRFIDEAEGMELLGLNLPFVRLEPWSPVQHLKAELALARYGIDFIG